MSAKTAKRKPRIEPQAAFDVWCRDVFAKESAQRLLFTKRFARYASQGGATEDDLKKFQELMGDAISLTYRLEYLERYVEQIEPHAEAARKVRSSRSTEEQLMARTQEYWPIYVCARDLVEAGTPRRGLAPKIKTKMGRKAPDVRQISRILKWFEKIRPGEFAPHT